MSFVPIEFKEDVELLRLPGPVEQIIISQSCKNILGRKSISVFHTCFRLFRGILDAFYQTFHRQPRILTRNISFPTCGDLLLNARQHAVLSFRWRTRRPLLWLLNHFLVSWKTIEKKLNCNCTQRKFATRNKNEKAISAMFLHVKESTRMTKKKKYLRKKKETPITFFIGS